MQIYYKYKTNTIDCKSTMFQIQNGADFFKNEWNYDIVTGSQIDAVRNFKQKKLVKNGVFTFRATSEEEYNANLSNIMHIFDLSNKEETAGQLCINGYCADVFPVVTDVQQWGIVANICEVEISFLFVNPYWIKEVTKAIDPYIPDLPYGKYPYKYPTRYADPLGLAGIITNDSQYPADFQIGIIGPASYPKIIIGGKTYELNAEIATGQYCQINSKLKTIELIDGTEKVNLFSSRSKVDDIFSQIEPGENQIMYNGSFPISVTIYNTFEIPQIKGV